MTTMINGVPVEALGETLSAIEAQPELAQFRFEAENEWIGGPVNRTTISRFYGTCQMHEHAEPFVFDADEPPVLLGGDSHANPVEYLLVALSGCLTTSMVAHASAKGIEIRGVQSRYEGDIDLRGFLGLSEEVPVGYQAIRVFFKIDADVIEAQKEEMIQTAQKYSPVFNTITRSAPVKVELDRA